ncbi:MAG TPA: zinc ribbon domain-containing protein [Conexibacter sp.]|nr:zinc ribbon domain-containing protein [Conexibacter sp.]
MDATTTQATVTCARCGAPLAEDQHYCLHCGEAQGDPRVAYRGLIAPAVTAPQAAVPALAPLTSAPPPALSRDWTPLLALGGLAALALVLVVGVLIGKSGTPTAAAPTAPQVITVSGAAPAATTTPTADASGGGSGGEARKAHKQTANDADPVDTRAGAEAVQDLNSASGEDYQRKSARLPDTVALPGEPPPRDNKAPGGGSDAETIG